jgi:hypothetical protein
MRHGWKSHFDSLSPEQQAAVLTFDGDDTIGSCPECNAPWEIVRPGKYQPTCACMDKCGECGAVRRHFAVGEIASNVGGFLCPVCDRADPEVS